MRKNKSLQALYFTLGWLAVGLLIVLIFQWLFRDVDSILLAILLISPIFIFVILSGQLSEFSTPGGWSAKFQEAASKRVSSGKDDIVEISEINQLTKGNREKLPETLRDLASNPKSPIALKIILDDREKYGFVPLSMWIESFFLSSNFKLILIVDKSEGYVGHISREYLLTLIIQGQSKNHDLRKNYEETLCRIVDLINDNDISGLQKESFLISQRIFEGLSNAEALEFMDDENLEFVVVVNSQNKVKGILEKNKIVSKMILSLINE